MDVDLIAARNLLVALGVDPDEHHLATASEHFSKYRKSLHKWLNVKHRQDLAADLESQHAARAVHRDDSWSAGYSCAEQIVAQWFYREIIEEPKPLSRGRALRSLIRRAKRTTGN